MCVTPPAGVDKYRDHGKLIRDVVAHCLKRVFTGPVAGRIPLLRTSGEEDRERERVCSSDYGLQWMWITGEGCSLNRLKSWPRIKTRHRPVHLLIILYSPRIHE